MKYWHSAFDQAKRRDLDEILSLLPGGVVQPFKYSAVSDLDSFLEAAVERGAEAPANIVLPLPAKEQYYVDHACMAAGKFFHIVDCVRSDFQRGALTWSVLESHHAALFGIRALAALFGLSIHRVHGRTMLVDVWPELGSPDHRSAFGKRHRTIADPVRLMMPTDERLLEQQHTWKLLARLLSIIVATSKEEADMLEVAQESASEFHSTIRNETMYYSTLWPDFADIQLARIYRNDKIRWLEDPVKSDPEVLQLVDGLYALCTSYLARVLPVINTRSIDVHFLANLMVRQRVYAA